MTKLLSFRGLDRVPVEEAEAGDIIAVAGLAEATVPDTIGAPELTAPLPAIPVDPPTLAMTFRINDGPLGGREGKKVTSPADPRAAVPRGRGQRRHQGHRQQRDRGVRGRRPRRTAARRADRADAPRGLRTHHRPPARADPRQSRHRRPRGADGGGAGRRGRALRRRGGREARPPQGRAARHAPLRRRQAAADLQHPEPRPDRLPRRIPHRHARHRRDEPAVRRLRPVEGPDRGAPQRLA